MFLEVKQAGQVSSCREFVRFLQCVCFISFFVKAVASRGTNRDREVCVCQGQVNEQLGKGALLSLLH